MIILVMGVTGAGKTTVGKLLTERLHWKFLDADDFHPPENIEKMKRGISLTDADREPWLAAIHAVLLECAAKNQDAVLACSALKQIYRDKLARGIDLRICYLKGSFEEISLRLEHRSGHFAGEGILAGQFADLEEPTNAVILNATASPEKNVRGALRKLNLSAAVEK
ncbi:MAG: gluconokinase [Candidatus Acidiferrales bacterium]